MGDRWVSDNLQSSPYIWLPLSISGSQVTMKKVASWVPNLADGEAGTWSASPDDTSYEGEDTIWTAGPRSVVALAAAVGEAAGYLGGGTDNAGKVSFPAVSGGARELTIVKIKVQEQGYRPQARAGHRQRR